MKLQVEADLSAILHKASVTAPRAAHCYCRPIVWWRHCAGQYMQVKHSSADLLSLHRLSQLIFILLLPPPKLQQLLVCLLQVGKELGVLLGQGIDLRLVLSNVRAELSVLGHHWVICRRQWRDSSAKQGPHSRVQARAGSSTACLTTGRSAAHSGAKGLSAWSCKLDPQSHYSFSGLHKPFCRHTCTAAAWQTSASFSLLPALSLAACPSVAALPRSGLQHVNSPDSLAAARPAPQHYVHLCSCSPSSLLELPSAASPYAPAAPKSASSSASSSMSSSCTSASLSSALSSAAMGAAAVGGARLPSKKAPFSSSSTVSCSGDLVCDAGSAGKGACTSAAGPCRQLANHNVTEVACLWSAAEAVQPGTSVANCMFVQAQQDVQLERTMGQESSGNLNARSVGPTGQQQHAQPQQTGRSSWYLTHPQQDAQLNRRRSSRAALTEPFCILHLLRLAEQPP